MENAAQIKSHFLLDPAITFLNFGSFGSCPRPVMEDYIRWHYELEAEPVQFMMVKGPRYLKESRDALGRYIGCDGDDVVFTMNPSYAINIIAKSFPLQEGDEILSTSLEYGTMDRTWKYYCRKHGAHYIRQAVSLPIQSKEEFINEFWKGYSPKTKAVFLSHITSSTGLILPVKEICERAKELGLITIVDGAHVPGQLPLDLRSLPADIYAGACHKWMMTPKGCSFLYVKKDFQHMFDPLLISWGFESLKPSHSRFIDYHELQGTRDFSAFLTVPAALRFMEEHHWPAQAARCRNLVQEYGIQLCSLLNTRPLAPLTGDFFGQLFSARIKTGEPEKLQQLLFQKYKIEIPVMRHDDMVFIRFSVQAYNSAEDLENLMNALKDMQNTTSLLN